MIPTIFAAASIAGGVILGAVGVPAHPQTDIQRPGSQTFAAPAISGLWIARPTRHAGTQPVSTVQSDAGSV